jgi:hypothetical protein
MTAFDLTSLLVLGELNPLMVQTSKNDKFIVQGDLEKLYKEFTKILQKDLKCSVSQKKNILKAQTQYQGQFIVMVIDFQPIVGDLCLCEVKRSKGGIIQFNTLCRTFIEKCKDKILHKSFLNK